MDENKLATLLSSAGLVMVGGFVAAGSRLLERVIIGRALSPEAYGTVSIGIALVAFSTTFALAGLSQGVPRFISRYDDEADKRGIWIAGLVVSGLFSLVIALLLFAGTEEILRLLFGGQDVTFVLYLFIASIPFIVVLNVAIGAIRGHENTIYRTYARDLAYPLGRVLLLSGLLLAGFGLTAAGYAYLIAAAGAAVLSHLLLGREMRLFGSFSLHTRELLFFSAPLVLSTVLTVLLGMTDTLMLGYFTNTYEVGQYEAAYPIASGMLVVLAAFGFLYLPMASRLDAEGDHEEINRLYATTTKWVYILTFPLFLVFVVFPADVMQIVFGREYVPAATVLPILAVGFFISTAVGRNRETLSALGETRAILAANAAGFTINVVLNLLLIPRLGFVGAGITSAVSFFLVHSVVLVYLKQEYDITPFSRRSVRTFVVLPATLIPLFWFFSASISLTMVTILPFLLVVGLVSIVVVSLTGGLQAEDEVAIEFVEDLIGSRVPLIRRYLPSEPSDHGGR